MSITKCTVWKTSDGRVFDTPAEAQLEEDKASLLAYLDNGGMYWREPDLDMLAGLVLEWLARRGAPEVE